MLKTGDGVSRLVLRTHGSLLLVITIINVVVASRGFFAGSGVFGVLREQGWGYIGLYQAYLLMFVIGITLWLGSTQTRLWRWDAIGLVAHLPPLTINFLAAPVFVRSGLGSASATSLAVHTTLISIEAGAVVQNLVRRR